MNKLALNFVLVRWTLGENICLSCLKLNLPWAPGQVIFLPLYMYVEVFRLNYVFNYDILQLSFTAFYAKCVPESSTIIV